MNTFKTFAKTTAVAIVGLTLASAASAATVGYNLEDKYAPVSAVNKSGSYADQYTYISGANAVKMDVNALQKSGSNFVDEKVGIFHGYGMGVENASGNQHTLDNNNGIDILTFTFEQEMILDAVTSGWHSGDSDISVFTVDGDTKQRTSYSLVDHYYNLVNDQAKSVNSAGAASKVWAISAHTGHTNDYVKLSFLSFTEAPSIPAPAPATLGLMGAVLAGLGLRRKAKRQS